MTERNQWKLVDHISITGMILIQGPAFPLAICAQATDITFPDYLRIMADARLLVAAPEMLELLRDVRQYVADANLRSDCYAEIDLKAIDALLAKIEGGGE